jgi:hypothetical protein
VTTTIDHDEATADHRPEGYVLGTADVFASIVALFVLSVAQPLLGLLGRNAEFFLAHASPPIDIVLLAFAVTFVAPLVLAAFLELVRRIDPTTGRVVHFGALMILGAALVLQVLKLTPLDRLSAWIVVPLVLAAGVGVAMAFYRFEGLRTAGRFAAIAPVVVLGMFLFVSSTSQLVFGSPAVAQAATIEVENPAPIVFAVFDEFPVASLMDGDGNLQEDVYPNFARLAEDGTWYRNTTTVQQQTERALPAIISGVDGSSEKIPTAADYPFTLFTLLAETYDLDVFEAVTDLCPVYACENSARAVLPFRERWSSLTDDLRIVAGHLFLPNDVTENLPPIDSSWSNFSAAQGGGEFEDEIIARFQALAYDDDRRRPIGEFLDALDVESDEPRLIFFHASVPHVPWDYLQSGQLYPSPGVAPGSLSPGWNDDEWRVNQAYQQHLVQVQYVDTVVGQIIDRLTEADLYDDALVVVVADHGIAIRPNIEHRRVVNDDTIGDVAAVPLFMKLPNQAEGSVSDYRAETVDILPTIADVLDVDIPWTTEGWSLIDDEKPIRTESRIQGRDGVVVFGTDGSEARAIAARKIDDFGSDGPYGLAPDGYAHLLGTPISGYVVTPSEDVSASIRDKNIYMDVDLDGPSLPAWIAGRLSFTNDEIDQVVLAVVVNDRVAAVTRSFRDKNDHIEYTAMLPPDAFVDGSNNVRVYLVSQVEGASAGQQYSLFEVSP